ncbi:MAG: hypothetical protein K2Q03_10210 [Sphingobacteriaceae bacterium]|nr:hypothetical protein [Sphingobacteriaceae bacterium]
MQNDLENNSWQNEFPTLAKMPKETPFAVPENYFESLTQRIKTDVSLAELKAKDFTIPENYFEKLQSEIVAKTNQKKTIGFNYYALIRYAAAASVVLIIASSIWMMQSKSKQMNTLTEVELQREQLLYELKEEDILDEINTSKQIENADADDMEAYILNNYTEKDITQEYKNK